MRTIIGVCLDESGSMGEGGKRSAAISAFNEYLHEQQRTKADECLMAIARFNSVARVSDKMTAIADVADLSDANYVPGGNTALFDAIAYTVREIERGIALDDRVVLVVLTDGEENASRETTRDQVKELIAAKESSQRWTFTYLSASPDAFAQGLSLGVSAGNIGAYQNNAVGVSHAVRRMSANLASYRRGTARASLDMAAGISSPVPTPPPTQQKGPTIPQAPPKQNDTDMWGAAAS